MKTLQVLLEINKHIVKLNSSDRAYIVELINNHKSMFDKLAKEIAFYLNAIENDILNILNGCN